MSDKKLIPQTDSGEREAYNMYYMHVSSLYRAGKWILLLLFTVFLIVMLLSYRESITYENLLYLTRNLNISAGGEGGFSSVVYEEQPNMAFTRFKNELVVAGSSGMSFYSGSGAVSFRDDTGCVTPVPVSSEKYLLVYDEGGTVYSLYTPIGRVLRETTDSAIQCADVGDTGVYAIAQRSHEARYLVSLYSASFREIARYYRDSYVTSLSVSPDGELLAILGVQPEGSALSGVLTLCRVGSEEARDIPLGEVLPLKASFLRDGTLVVVTDGAVLFFGPDGSQRASVSLSSTVLSCMSISDTRTVLVCSENTLGTSNRVIVLDSGGNVLSEITVSEKISGAAAADGDAAAYLLCRERVLVLSASGAVKGEIAYTGNLMAVCEITGQPVFCFASGAKIPGADS